MPKHLPLDTLIELAQSNTDKATRRLGQLQAAQTSAKGVLETLLQYRQEYLNQLEVQLSGGVAAAALRNFQHFIGTLDAAIEQQRAVALQADSQLTTGRSDWQHSKRRLTSFDTLAYRARQQALIVLNKREQKDNDERASRRIYSARTNFGQLA
jgi:flagellar FliJ protein